MCVLPAFFLLTGCGAKGQPIDVMLSDANSLIASAQESGAEQLAEPEFREAANLLSEAQAALENKDKNARSLIMRAQAQARLADALAKQSKAEADAAQAEAELEQTSEEASRAQQERKSAEEELAQMASD